ncbi:uncharacterized protein LOC129790466 isoform X1 [Lutzomyia longipalpis]|uniref:uncharacterized protein LOC129790466 isoform X1 n=1 Tax=Lutzomyia longipalpis TaxID=7200 RepID=UPI00248466B0|nr:uncharacterized protein LOC129790466 isoform X1 [Lutzomyia longipalpis]XP_055683931.1 uncharacterized protein LOC129790466 isoform X1 [Lutzomyia longipalpis]
MSLIEREGIIKAISKTESFVSGLSSADTAYLDRKVLQMQIHQVNNLQAKFESVQDDIISHKTGKGKDHEASFKHSVLMRCAKIIQDTTHLLTFYPKEEPCTDTSPSGTLCSLMREMIQQNNQLFAKLTATASTITPIDSRSLRLPQIELPKFSGEYCEWIPFKNRFNSFIANIPNLSKVQKLDYLKASLSGDAASTIGYLPTTESNFDVAWELLRNRFEINSETIAGHGRNPCDMPSVSPSDPSQRCINATHPATTSAKSNSRSHPSAGNSSKEYANDFHTTAAASKCQCCDQSSHPLYKCPQFLAQNPDEKYETVKTLNLCRNCLAPHLTRTCTYRKCRRCQGRHNILLHDKFVGESAANPPAQIPTPSAIIPPSVAHQPAPTPGVPAPNHSSALSASAVSERTLQPGPRVSCTTAMVDVLTVSGEKISCRALLDSRVPICIMTSNLLQKLKLPKSLSEISVVGIGNQPNSVKHKVTATISSQRSNVSHLFNCNILSEISGNISTWDVDTNALRPPLHIPHPDPDRNVSRPVDLNICSESYRANWVSDIFYLGSSLPPLREIFHGYVIVDEHKPPPQVQDVHHVNSTPILEEMLCTSGELEEPPDEASVMNQQLQSDAHFSRTYQRFVVGRFNVRFLVRNQPDPLKISCPQSVRQSLALERQVNKKPPFAILYVEVMRHRLKKKWLWSVSLQDPKILNYFISHQGMMKDFSTSTELRMMPHVSAKLSSDDSLNDLTPIGPMVFPDHAVTFLRFRLHLHSKTADILKMDPEDYNFYQLMWQSFVDDTLRDRYIPKVCCEVTSPPHVILRALVQLFDGHNAEVPLASSIVRFLLYVDNTTPTTFSLNGDSIMNHLNFQTSVYAYMEIHSRRTLAPAIAQLFNPYSLIGSFIIEAAVMLQCLHQLIFEWDEYLSRKILHHWNTFAKGLPVVQFISILLWIYFLQQLSRIVLHVCGGTTRSTSSGDTLRGIYLPQESHKVVAFNHIRTSICIEQLHHVEIDQISAESISRGASPSDPQRNNLWWKNPEWLQHPGNQQTAPSIHSKVLHCFITVLNQLEDKFKGLIYNHCSLFKFPNRFSNVYIFSMRDEIPNPHMVPLS